MKTIKYLIYLTATVTLLNSCDLLDLSPEDSYGSNNFWSNEEQVKGFILGTHSQLRQAHTNLWLMGEARGGLQKHGNSSMSTSLDYSSPFKDQDFSKDKSGLSSWGGFYERILNLNMAINKVEKECSFLSDESRGYYLGQLYGLRAFNYFWLYRTYGGVPINSQVKVLDGITNAEPLYLERSSPKVTLDFIKADITLSEQGFGTNVSMPYGSSVWSKFATLMLKAEVYLWSAKVITGDQIPASGDLEIAEVSLNEVKGKFALLDNFSDVFAYNSKSNSEIIFALRFQENEATNFAFNFTYLDNLFVGLKFSKDLKVMGDTLQLKGSGHFRSEYVFSLFESYDDLDTRKTATFLDFYDKSSTEPYTPINGGLALRKCIGALNASGVRIYGDDIPIYRYADVLLMLAEVENKKGSDPAPYINEIRERAYGENYDVAIHGYVNSDFATNELAILCERDKEFVFELKRWFDVLRLQDATEKPLVFSTTLPYGFHVPILDPITEGHKVLWPVDVITLSMDPKLIQTIGY